MFSALLLSIKNNWDININDDRLDEIGGTSDEIGGDRSSDEIGDGIDAISDFMWWIDSYDSW